MTTSPDDPIALPPARLTLPILAILLGFTVKLGFTVNAWLLQMPADDAHVLQTLLVYAMNLLLVGALWFLSRRTPSKLKTLAMLALLAMLVMAGISMAAALGKYHAERNLPWEAWIWRVKVIFGANLLIAAGAIWGLLGLPWRSLKGPDEPRSPATRRTQMLFGLSGIVGVLAVVAVAIATRGDMRDAIWSNSQNLSAPIALIAIAIWLLSMALSWWWYFSADEHERRANDVGFLAGGGLFIAVTPIWWIGSRAGLLPPPDAMILWYATMVAIGIGWWRYRSR